MAEEKKNGLERVHVFDSGTTAHIERQMEERVDYAETTAHIEQKMATITTPLTTPVVAKAASQSNSSGE